MIIQIASHESYRWLYRNEEALLLPSSRRFSPRYGRINSASSLIVSSPRGIYGVSRFPTRSMSDRRFATFSDPPCNSRADPIDPETTMRQTYQSRPIFSLILESIDISASGTLTAVIRDHLESNVRRVIQRCVTRVRLRNKIARSRGTKIR